MCYADGMTVKCAYHGGCPDGFAAAMAVVETHGASNVELIPVGYGDDPPEVTDEDPVYIVDFSFTPEQTIELASKAAYVRMFDHHDTAFKQWVAYTGESDSGPGIFEFKGDRLEILIDQSRSGAGITWDEIVGRRPTLINYVEDRDLWKWELPGSRVIGTWIQTVPYTVDAWTGALALDLGTLGERAEGACDYEEKMVTELVDRAHQVEMGGRTFWLTQSSYIGSSRVAEAVMEAKDADMAGYWLINAHSHYQYGFRSRNGVTVNDFAEQFGGGGHPQAAGCWSETPLHDLPGLP